MPKIILIGDLQRTLLVERICGREQNDRERMHVLSEAAKESSVDAFWFLGDLVDVGALSSSWAYFDRVSKPVFDSPAAKNAIYGNHDYWGWPSQIRAHIQKRFSNLLPQNFQVSHYGSLAVISLDSNRVNLGAEIWSKQLQWFQETLNRLEADSSVKEVVVFSHHPPFTNSKRYGGKRDYQVDWVPLFTKASKTRAWISGHVHAYEKFQVNQKHFIIMGSSGGPRAPLLTGKKQRLPDLFTGTQPRPFVFSSLEHQAGKLCLQVKGFQKGDFTVKTIDSIELI